MKTGWTLLAALGAILGSGVAALLAAPTETSPALPFVRADGSVSFKLAWPGEAKVELVARGPNQHDFAKEVYPMPRDADGYYSVAVPAVPPGVHFYKFRVDGADVLDPRNPAVQGFFNGPWSRFEMSDATPQPWTPRVAPHGALEERRYASVVLGQERTVWVYLPPDYDPGRGVRYPVIYLLHGSTYDERSWWELGRVGTIVDNLVADHRIRPLVVVMPSGYSGLATSSTKEPAKEYEPWARHMVEDLLPWTEKNYAVARDRDVRAVAGLSMGGAQAMRLGLSHPELFGVIGGFSAGKNAVRQFSAAYAASFEPGGWRPDLLWLGCGRGDRYFSELKTLPAAFAAKGLSATWHETDGRHTWRVWRECFCAFVQQAFPATVSGGGKIL